jgi:NAD(P)-dependent dehydrogenase (short-subunit alcohol dehydrogenase family)
METIDGAGAVITGGASGIGFAAARELCSRGARVVLADIEQHTLDGAVTELRDDGFEASGVVCDVRHLEQVEHLADEAFRILGQVRVLFNNAGVGLSGPITQLSHDDWRWVIDVDLWGPIHGVEAFVPRMVEQGGGGHVLFTSSFAGLVPNVGLGAYCVAKYGVVALGEVLARELRDDQIGVTIVCPMMVETNIGTSQRNRGDEYGGSAAPAVPSGAPRRPRPEGLDVLAPSELARLTVDAILANRLYVLPHHDSRVSITRRFERIDRTFGEQEAAGWNS